MWTTPEWPDGPSYPGESCGPCLFDVWTDPDERVELSAAYPEVVTELAATLDKVQHWQTGNDHYVGPHTNCITIDQFSEAHGHFVGPLCTAP